MSENALYGNSNSHLTIRSLGVRYLKDNPERFIESIVGMSWSRYLTNMSLQGTWANHIIIQAVADAMNLKIHIIESDSNYREITLVQPANATSDIRSIYIGHMGQMHYVSTCNSFEQDSNHRNANDIQQTIPNDSVQNEFSEIVTDKDTGIITNNSNQTRKRDRAAYMRQYRKLNNSPEKRLKRNEYLKKYREMNASPEKRSKTNEYLKKYREINASPEKRLKTNEYQREYRQGHKTSMEFAINRFNEIVNQGPLYVCTSCDQLWYKHSVRCTNKLRQSKPDIVKYLLNKTSVGNKEWVCQTCSRYLMKNKVPPCSIANGMAFPVKPDFFDLNELECRLLAPRIAFQKLMQAPRGRQLKIHGNIVNVPADVTHTVSILPRLQNQTATIKVNLKRKLKYKSSALSLNVRPYKVFEAANWLISHSNLYKDEGIVLNNDWINQHSQDANDVNNDNSYLQQDTIDETSDNEEIIHNEIPQDESESTAGVTDTMFTATDFLEDEERQNILNIAPGEGNRPLSVFRDKYYTLFCSFSSAETQWIHLLRILGQLVDHKEYTDEEISNFNWDNRCRLIQSDPVTCARHFDYQVNQFLTDFLFSSTEPLGKISDWFYRVEYQQRGSHIHMLLWLENVPQFQEDSDNDVTAFIDKIITCQKPIDNAELLNLVNRQVHRHSHTCRKNTSSKCRFNYPQPPMKQTMILYPLDEETSDSEIRMHKNNWKLIKCHCH